MDADRRAQGTADRRRARHLVGGYERTLATKLVAQQHRDLIIVLGLAERIADLAMFGLAGDAPTAPTQVLVQRQRQARLVGALGAVFVIQPGRGPQRQAIKKTTEAQAGADAVGFGCDRRELLDRLQLGEAADVIGTGQGIDLLVDQAAGVAATAGSGGNIATEKIVIAFDPERDRCLAVVVGVLIDREREFCHQRFLWLFTQLRRSEGAPQPVVIKLQAAGTAVLPPQLSNQSALAIIGRKYPHGLALIIAILVDADRHATVAAHISERHARCGQRGILW